MGPEVSKITSLTPSTTPARLRVIYQNDTHMAWTKLPQAITAFDLFTKAGKEKGSDVLRLHTGDYMTGSSETNFSLALWISNRMGLHAAALGNHEFDMGVPTLVEKLKTWANFPTLVGNFSIKPTSLADKYFTQLRQTGQLKVEPQIIRKRSGTYGLLGVTQVAEDLKIQPQNETMGVATQSFAETVAHVRKEVEKLRKQGVVNIILMSHMGFERDSKLAQQVDGVSVILGGDSHHVLHGAQRGVNLLKSPSGRDVLVLQAGYYSDYIGVADLQFDASGQPIHIQNQLYPAEQFQKDAMTESVIDQVLAPNRLVCHLTQPFLRNRRIQAEQPLAEFMADALRTETQTDIALLRRGEVRRNIPAGDLFSRDVETNINYDSPQVILKVTGAAIQQGLKEYVQATSSKNYGVIYSSGLKYTIHAQDKRVSGVQVFNRAQKSWESIDDAKHYTVALSDYILKNPEILPTLADPKNVIATNPKAMKDILIEALQRHSNSGGRFTPPKSDGRLTIVK